MFHRRYSASASRPADSQTSPVVPEAAGFTHQVQMPETDATVHRERLKQRQEEVLRQQQLIQAEQELDGILEEEKELARRREELQTLNDRQTAFHDRRLILEDRINQALLDFDRESRQSNRQAKALERALETCRRFQAELEQMAPAVIPSLRSESGLRRQLDFLADFEHRLEVELSGLEDSGTEAGSRDRVIKLGFGDSLLRGLRFFWPVLGLGTIGLLIILSVTGGGK